MKLQEISVYRIKLPLVTPYRVSFKVYTEFDPIIIEARDEDGALGWGEAHIPTGSSFETADSGWRFCCEQAPHLLGNSLSVAKEFLEKTMHSAPNATTAMMTAIEMLERPQVLQVSTETRVPLLKVVGSTDEEDIKDEVERHIAEGYETLKVKVGWDVLQDLARVEMIRRFAAGRAELSLDANRAFSREDGCRFAAALNPQGIKLMEQPCAANDWEANAAVAKTSAVPLMLDESITSVTDIERAATIPNVGYVKMKLKRVGGIGRAQAALARAREVGLTACFGDGVASEIGCWMEACIVRGMVDTAGEMNGFLKPRVRLLANPLQYERGAITLSSGFWPQINREVLATHSVASERFAPVQVAY
jgi:L-Ala-D/L-Glu epimerase